MRLTLLLALFLAAPAQAGTLLMKVPTLTGDSSTAGYDAAAGWFNIDSVATGVERSVGRLGSGGGDREMSNPSFSELSVTRVQSVGSVGLWSQAISGRSLGTAEVVYLTDAGDVQWRVELGEAIVTTHIVESGELALPVETVTFNFTSITTHPVGGGPSSCWDILRNRSC